MIDYQKIIDYYYPETDNPSLRNILLVHSRSVAELAVRIVDNHPELGADRDFVYAAAMLHDIGIVRCDADGICCHGTEPYICHGVLGAKMLMEYAQHEASLLTVRSALPLASSKNCSLLTVNCSLLTDIEPYCRVCARHTGTGLTVEAIRRQHLPLPEEDLQPETIEEKMICYADKFFSKTKLDRQKTFEQAEHSLMKFGEEGLVIFRQWHKMFAL